MCIFNFIFSKWHFTDDVIFIRFNIRTRISVTLLKCINKQ